MTLRSDEVVVPCWCAGEVVLFPVPGRAQLYSFRLGEWRSITIADGSYRIW